MEFFAGRAAKPAGRGASRAHAATRSTTARRSFRTDRNRSRAPENAGAARILQSGAVAVSQVVLISKSDNFREPQRRLHQAIFSESSRETLSDFSTLSVATRANLNHE